MSKTKLLPCPFCGGKNIKMGSKGCSLGIDNYIKCNCGAKIQIAEEYGETELVKRWNARKPIDDIVERLEKSESVKNFGSVNSGNLLISLKDAIDIVRNAGKEGTE